MLLAADNLTKSYGTRPALADLSFTVDAGEVVSIVGLNGAGKTTTLKIILGLLRPDRGQVRFGSGDHRPFGAIGYLPEESRLPPDLTPQDLLADQLRLAGLEPADAAIAEALTAAGILSIRHLRTSKFSKGMGRRLDLALALVPRPRLLVMDEPQSGFDPVGRADLSRIIGELKTCGIGILIASHDLHEIELVADRALLLHSGHLLAEIPVKELRPGGLKRRFFELVKTA